MLKFLMAPTAKRIIGITMAVGSGVGAVVGALNDQKKAQEFEAMKLAIIELQNQIKK